MSGQAPVPLVDISYWFAPTKRAFMCMTLAAEAASLLDRHEQVKVYPVPGGMGFFDPFRMHSMIAARQHGQADVEEASRTALTRARAAREAGGYVVAVLVNYPVGSTPNSVMERFEGELAGYTPAGEAPAERMEL